MYSNEPHQHGGPHGHKGHRRRRSFGPGRGDFPGFGFPFGGHGPRGRGRRARRGDIRTAALLLLAEDPRNGYQIMQEVEERSGGLWRPSPGSVYPALSQLEDEGLIRSEEGEGGRRFALTDEGRKVVEERGEDRPAPWEEMGGEASEGIKALAKAYRELSVPFAQVIRTGSEIQITRAAEALETARRELYRILADGEGTTEA